MNCLSRRKKYRNKDSTNMPKTNRLRWKGHLIGLGSKFYKTYRLIIKIMKYLSLVVVNRRITNK